MKSLFLTILISTAGLSFSQSVEQGDIIFESYYGIFSFDSKKVFEENQYNNLTNTRQGTLGFKFEYLVLGEMSSLISGLGYGLEFANSNDEFTYTNTIQGEFGNPNIIQNANIKRNSKNFGMVLNTHLFPFLNKLDVSLNTSIGFKKESFTYTFSPQDLFTSNYVFKDNNFYLTCQANVKYYLTKNIGLSGALGYSNFGMVRFGIALKL